MELSNDIKVLKDLVTVLLAKIEALESEASALRAENAEMRSRLNLNSKNSHKPPSSDGLSKKCQKPGLPKGPSKKSGGQPGHKGKTLKMVDKPDGIVVHHVASCPCCAKIFSPANVVDEAQKRQAFDISAPRMEVTEHQLGVVVCYGRYHLGSFPSEVRQAYTKW
jgi:transposase